MLEAVKENPIFFFLALVAAAAGLVLGGLGLALGRKSASAATVLAIGALLACFASGVAGLLGMLASRANLAAVLVVPGLSEADRARIRAGFDASATANLLFGLAVAAPALALGILALLRARRFSARASAASSAPPS